MELSKRIEQLEWQIKTLADKQNFFNDNISKLQSELKLLNKEFRGESSLEDSTRKTIPKAQVPLEEKAKKETVVRPRVIQEVKPSIASKATKPPAERKVKRNDLSSNQGIEKFIGKNLILIGGIVILVLGLAFGVKYSIDHNILGEKARIFLAYAASLGLLGFSMKLRKKYSSFSAVLLSGACCSLYITTYVAFDVYGFISRPVTFGLMLLFTVFTVLASVSYNRSIIAHLGLLGAYAIPFLTSQNSGNYPGLMTYVTIINVGILFLSFKKDWKSLKIVSFAISWLLFLFALYDDFSYNYWNSALSFATIFYLIFFGIILAYKFIKDESLKVLDVILVLLNTITYYSIGYFMLEDRDWQLYQGPFTLFVALINFIPAYKIFTDKNRSDHLIHFLGTIVLTLITIAIPVQLDGNWVTLFWIIEGGLLLWLARKKNVKFMEVLGFILVLLSFFSFIDDIGNAMHWGNEAFKPLYRIEVFANLLYCVLLTATLFIIYKREENLFGRDLGFRKIAGYLVAFLSFMAFLILGGNENFTISSFYHYGSRIEIGEYSTAFNRSIKLIAIITYYIYFCALVGAVHLLANWFKRKSDLKNVLLVLKGLALFIFLFAILPILQRIGLFHFNPPNEYFVYGKNLVFLRYPIIGLAIAFAISIYRHVKRLYSGQIQEKLMDVFLYASLFITLAYELIFWMRALEVPEPYKLGLTILGAVYTIYLIIRGIFARKAHLRYFGFVLLGIVLLKLFFYDIAHLKTLSKTIVLVAVGVCMLVSSFLYNKYTSKLFSDE